MTHSIGPEGNGKRSWMLQLLCPEPLVDSRMSSAAQRCRAAVVVKSIPASRSTSPHHCRCPSGRELMCCDD